MLALRLIHFYLQEQEEEEEKNPKLKENLDENCYFREEMNEKKFVKDTESGYLETFSQTFIIHQRQGSGYGGMKFISCIYTRAHSLILIFACSRQKGNPLFLEGNNNSLVFILKSQD